MTRFLCSRFFSGYAFWLQPARACRNSSLPLYHGLPRCLNGQLRRGETSLENSQMDCSRPLFRAGRPYGRCHRRKYGISQVYWQRGSLQVSDVNKSRRSSGMWVCSNTCCTCSKLHELRSVVWEYFEFSDLNCVVCCDIRWSCLRCTISVICVWLAEMPELCIVATDHDKSVW